MQLPFAIRDLGQRLFGTLRVPIASGINQGLKWSIVTTGRGYGSGTFGKDRLEVLQAVVRPGDCFWDVGAHKGFVSLAASRMVGPSGTVVSIEPSQRNRWFLQRHIDWNGVDNVTVLPIALSGHRGEAAFGGTGDSLAYELGRGDERVAVRTVADVVAGEDLPPPDVLKIDAEGQEAAILKGGEDGIPSHAALLISVHGREMHDACSGILLRRGFRLFESWEMAACTRDPREPWTSDYDLLAVGPHRELDQEHIRSLALFNRP
ncbi:MAG: FkbM family methyltransferase [Longimicrobiales bacterium]|nr:FkbM family methyltransferase [Longimicrobiales bacterium]